MLNEAIRSRGVTANTGDCRSPNRGSIPRETDASLI